MNMRVQLSKQDLTMTLDHTHDPAARSWLAAANAAGCDFPIQNLPFAVLRRRGSGEAFRGAVAIGDQALDLAALAGAKLLTGAAGEALTLAAQPTLNAFMAAGPEAWRALRHALFALLREGAPAEAEAAVRAGLLPLAEVEYTLPARVGDYTDFYTSLDHARELHAHHAAGRRRASQLPLAAAGLSRPRVHAGGERAALSPAARPVAAAGRQRAGVRPLRRDGLRMRAGAVDRPRQRGRPADTDRPGASSTCSASACSTTGRRATSRCGRWRRWGPSTPRTSPPPSRPGS
jgi:hypothetical protein